MLTFRAFYSPSSIRREANTPYVITRMSLRWPIDFPPSSIIACTVSSLKVIPYSVVSILDIILCNSQFQARSSPPPGNPREFDPCSAPHSGAFDANRNPTHRAFDPSKKCWSAVALIVGMLYSQPEFTRIFCIKQFLM